jgi:DNA-binding MarR family transcriptional regulator
MNTAQLTLLQVLAKAGPITHGQLGRALALDSTTLSRTLRPIEAKRWIRRDPGQDRRERRIELTKAGHGQLERANPAWERAQQRLKAKLGAQRFEGLLADLRMLAGAAQQA